jgi:predicted Zn-dependent protease
MSMYADRIRIASLILITAFLYGIIISTNPHHEKLIQGDATPGLLPVQATNTYFTEESASDGGANFQDGRVGKVLDAQGVVSVRPRIPTVLYRCDLEQASAGIEGRSTMNGGVGINKNDPTRPGRNTPIQSGMILMPLDVVATGSRGANAIRMRLLPQTIITMGPQSTVRLDSIDRIHLLEGEMKIQATSTDPLHVSWDGGMNEADDGATSILVENEMILSLRRNESGELTPVRLAEPPIWLQGIEGTVNEESMGSLVATIDEQPVPLSVGYLNVTVDIRDQIARTVIEESFVNHTNNQLEGVFYFPLPHDASIAGFGMWIGGELIEADVVEKQRAREIYETILRERRDPALLEWTGGNLFKARVFPILPNSEKRIKITYTQVLPLKNGKYRYSYALQSEMLRINPLRQLQINLRVGSVLPLKQVGSPTHPTFLDQSAHAAHVVFEAQDYTPTHDFEVVIEPDVSTSPIVMTPHQRGEDGYFLLQVIPPDATDATWTRELIPNPAKGDYPLNLIILCDTSGSIDPDSRKCQLQWIETILRSLGSDDSFQVAACDVEYVPLGGRGPLVTEGRPSSDWISAIDDSLDALEARHSLGWSDLEKAFTAIFDQVSDIPNTHVIYVGDGVQNTYESDAAVSAARLRTIYGEKTSDLQHPPTCHAVSIGSSFEINVLNALASFGQGTVRNIKTDEEPSKSAKQLLQEMTAPGLKNLRVEFEGIRTARVYPERLPNLPSGKQQILLGRYLPECEDQQGRVIVTGELDGRPVRYEADFLLPKAEEGSSFIPRLWARMELDALLQEGASQKIINEIIALSERYHIMTPYTSFLVLESDAQRERFGVNRRFLMRDGERFFQEGRADMNYELLQKYVAEAGAWRTGLRRRILQSLKGMGRTDYGALRNEVQQFDEMQREMIEYQKIQERFSGLGTLPLGVGYEDLLPLILQEDESGRLWENSDSRNGWESTAASNAFVDPFGGLGESPFHRSGTQADFGAIIDLIQETVEPESWDFWGASGSISEYEGNLSLVIRQTEDVHNSFQRSNGRSVYDTLMSVERSHVPISDEPPIIYPDADVWQQLTAYRLEHYGSIDISSSGMSSGMGTDPFSSNSIGMAVPQYAQTSAARHGYEHLYSRNASGEPIAGVTRARTVPESLERMLGLFPSLRGPSPAGEPVESGWSDDAVKLAETLLRRDELLTSDGGWRISTRSEYIETRWGTIRSIGESKMFYSADRWALLNGSDEGSVEYVDGARFGKFRLDYHLGQSRQAVAADLEHPNHTFIDHMFRSLEETEGENYLASVEPTEIEGVVELVLTYKEGDYNVIRYRIDTERNVVLSWYQNYAGQVRDFYRYGDFVEIGGVWFPGLLEVENSEGRVLGTNLFTYERMNEAEYELAFSDLLSKKEELVSIDWPIPTLAEVRSATAEGEAGAVERFILACRYLGSDENERAYEEWEHAKRILEEENEQGVFWLDLEFLYQTKQHELMKQKIFQRALEYVADIDPEECDSTQMFRILKLNEKAARICGVDERLELARMLRPFYEAAPKHTHHDRSWSMNYVSLLQAAGQTDEALVEAKRTAEKFTRITGPASTYIQMLIQLERYEEAEAFAFKTCIPQRKWNASETQSIFSNVLSSLNSRNRYDRLVAVYEHVFESTEITNAYTYDSYLSALILSGQCERAFDFIREWISEPRPRHGELMSPVQRAKLNGALEHAHGKGGDMRLEEGDPQFFELLAETGLYFAFHNTEFSTARRIFDDRFTQSEYWDDVLLQLKQYLQENMGTMPPERIEQFFRWLPQTENESDTMIDRKIGPKLRANLIASLQQRWDEASDRSEDWHVRRSIASTLIRFLPREYDKELYFSFLKKQWDAAPDQYADQYAETYFSALLGRPYDEAIEEEAFATLARLGEHEELDRTIRFSEPREGDEQTIIGDPEPKTTDDLIPTRPLMDIRTFRGRTPINGGVDTKKISSLKTAVQVNALHRLNGWGVNQRTLLLNEAIEDPNGLSQSELQLCMEENRAEAIRAFLLRVQDERTQLDESLHPWLDLEIISFSAELPEVDIDALADICRELLHRDPKNRDVHSPGAVLLQSIVLKRAFTSLQSLSMREDADPQIAEDVLSYIDLSLERIAEDTLTLQDQHVESNEASEESVGEEPVVSRLAPGIRYWRQTKIQMLIALDRSEALEQELRNWAAESVRPNPWRVSLAHLLAEQGEVDALAEAIGLLEGVRADDELSVAEVQILCNWHLALNHRAAYEQAKRDIYDKMSEDELTNWLKQQLQNIDPRRRSGNATNPYDTLDEDVLLAFDALLQKSDSLTNIVLLLKRYYPLLRDPRFLQPLPQSVLGHASGRLSSTLASLERIIESIEDEATVDEIVQGIGELRETTTLKSDLRALDMLEFVVESRAARLSDQSDQHADLAWNALHRAYSYPLSEHEAPWAAEYLKNSIDSATEFTRATTGSTNGANIDSFQHRAVELYTVLHRQTEPGSIDRLNVGLSWYDVLLDPLDREEEALLRIEADMNEYLRRNNGVIEPVCYEQFEKYIIALRRAGRFRRAETILLDQMEHNHSESRSIRMKRLIILNYQDAFKFLGVVSIGSTGSDSEREAFYQKLRVMMEQEVAETNDPGYQKWVVDSLMQVFRKANDYDLPSVEADLREFAFVRLPLIVELQSEDRSDMFYLVSNGLNELVSQRDALELMILCIETQPAWMARGDYRYGGRFGSEYSIGRHHSEYEPKDPALEKRLLKITLDALREDLLSCGYRDRTLYGIVPRYYWKEKSDAFLTVANEVFEEKKHSRRHVVHIAEYLFRDVEQFDRAVEMLFDAHQRGLLDESQRFDLVQKLHRPYYGKYNESIPLLYELMRDAPDNIYYRTSLMKAYRNSGRNEELLDILQQTHNEFHERGLWDDYVLIAMASACLEVKLYEHAIEYYNELIPMHKRTFSGREGGDLTLCSYYQYLATSFDALDRTQEAVDAVCSSIVAAGSDHNFHESAEQYLRSMLARTDDLDAYAAYLDEEYQRTELDNLTVRRALAEAYLNKFDADSPLEGYTDIEGHTTNNTDDDIKRNEAEKALIQTRIAISLNPNDRSLYELLSQIYDKLGDSKSSIQATLDTMAIDPHGIDYADLADRYEKQSDDLNAERARTTTVELRPNEPNPHVQLAEIREKQERWTEAIIHWERAAAMGTEDPHPILRIGRIYVETEQWDEFIETMERIRVGDWELSSVSRTDPFATQGADPFATRSTDPFSTQGAEPYSTPFPEPARGNELLIELDRELIRLGKPSILEEVLRNEPEPQVTDPFSSMW